MAKIFIFRHGQTSYNREKIFTGWDDPDIDDDGIKECMEIAEQLRNERPTKAYTSDLKRAQHTLYIALGEKGKDVPVVIDSRIKERSYGELTKMSKTETQQKYPREYPLWHRSYDVAPPGGESIADVEKRVLPFIKEMLSKMKKDDVVFISVHGNSLRPMRKYFEKLSTEEMCTFEHPRAKVYKYKL